MNKVITISLNGNAYQIEEDGHAELKNYLDSARARLAENPDKDEIMRDLEQAVADKLARFLNAHKSVATAAEVAQAIKEMGPVDPSTGSGQAGEEAPAAPAAGAAQKNLYRIPQGAVLAGVASGIAAYFNLDATLVRVLFVVLTLLTGGGWIVAYIAMAIIIPRAETPEQVSRAYGAPFNAQEVIDRARLGFDDMRSNARRWKQERRAWRQHWKDEARRAKWETKYAYTYSRCHHHSVLGELCQVAFLVLIIWAIYHFFPGTHAFYHTIGADIQNGWAWLNMKVAR